MIPVQRIGTPQDLEVWIGSETFNLVINFITDLQNLILGLTNDAKVEVSKPVQTLIGILERVETIIEENPIEEEKNVSRFGKVEFKAFYDQVNKESKDMLSKLTTNEDDVTELGIYFQESWGNRKRIDYGSGHELNFLSVLLCMKQLNILTELDYPSVILKAFTKYLLIMRKLQKTYWLEPAGSHGVWGLDDYHFLPFLFGASQLATHPYMKPKLIHNEELVDNYYQQYMYFECIHFTKQIKTVPTNQQKVSLRWHSPMLDDILSAKSWTKIKEGMVKMYKAEVLSKLPVIRHFMFGSLIKCPEGISEYSESDDDSGHHNHAHPLDDHSHNTWGDCCGIKIPSAIAASELQKLSKNQNRFKPVPLD